MRNNAQKTHLARTLNQFAEQKVLDQIEILGKSLPCRVTAVSGSIVTVKFEMQTDFTLPEVTVPMFGPEYIRYPTKVDDLGVVMAADVYLGGVSGLGGGVASFTPQSNLSALVFFPIANKNWSATDNKDAVVIYGPDGAIIRTLDKKTTLTIKKAGVTLDTNKGMAITAHDQSTINADGETLTIGGGSIRSSGVLKAGNGTTATVTISGHTITVHDGIVTGLS